MRSRRMYRWALGGVILLAGLSVTLDVVALQVLQSRAGVQIARGTAAERASVDLGGLPFLPGYLRGRLREVEVDVVGASAGGLRVATLQVRFEEARFPSGRMTSLARSRHATRAQVRGERPYGRAEIGEFDLDDVVQALEPAVERVRIGPAGVEVFLPADDDEAEPVAVRYLPRIEDRRLVLRLVGLAGVPRAMQEVAHRIEGLIDLPQLPEGLRTDIQLGEGLFIVESEGAAFELWVGEAADEDIG